MHIPHVWILVDRRWSFWFGFEQIKQLRRTIKKKKTFRLFFASHKLEIIIRPLRRLSWITTTNIFIQNVNSVCSLAENIDRSKFTSLVRVLYKTMENKIKACIAFRALNRQRPETNTSTIYRDFPFAWEKTIGGKSKNLSNKVRLATGWLQSTSRLSEHCLRGKMCSQTESEKKNKLRTTHNVVKPIWNIKRGGMGCSVFVVVPIVLVFLFFGKYA